MFVASAGPAAAPPIRPRAHVRLSREWRSGRTGALATPSRLPRRGPPAGRRHPRMLAHRDGLPDVAALQFRHVGIGHSSQGTRPLGGSCARALRVGLRPDQAGAGPAQTCSSARRPDVLHHPARPRPDEGQAGRRRDRRRGTFVIELLPEAAPNHVGYFMKLAPGGRLRRDDVPPRRQVRDRPGRRSVSKDPAKRAQYGTGGLGRARSASRAARAHAGRRLGRAAARQARQRGRAVLHLRRPTSPRSTASTRSSAAWSRGIEVVEQISASPVDADGKLVDRVEMTRVTVRDTPPPEPEPFSTETPEELARTGRCSRPRSARSPSSCSPIARPSHVRNFLRLAQAGVYDGMAFHRVVAGFVAQTGSLTTRATPLTAKQQPFVRTARAGVQRDQARARASCRWRAATIRPAPRRRSSSAWAHARARRQVHGLRDGRRRARRAGGHRTDAGGAARRRQTPIALTRVRVERTAADADCTPGARRHPTPAAASPGRDVPRARHGHAANEPRAAKKPSLVVECVAAGARPHLGPPGAAGAPASACCWSTARRAWCCRPRPSSSSTT